MTLITLLLDWLLVRRYTLVATFHDGWRGALDDELPTLGDARRRARAWLDYGVAHVAIARGHRTVEEHGAAPDRGN